MTGGYPVGAQNTFISKHTKHVNHTEFLGQPFMVNRPISSAKDMSSPVFGKIVQMKDSFLPIQLGMQLVDRLPYSGLEYVVIRNHSHSVPISRVAVVLTETHLRRLFKMAQSRFNSKIPHQRQIPVNKHIYRDPQVLRGKPFLFLWQYLTLMLCHLGESIVFNLTRGVVSLNLLVPSF